MIGKDIRIERIMDRNTGRAVIVPMDHGFTLGQIDGLLDMTKDHIRGIGRRGKCNRTSQRSCKTGSPETRSRYRAYRAPLGQHLLKPGPERQGPRLHGGGGRCPWGRRGIDPY